MDLTFALTTRTCRDIDELAEDAPLGLTHLARAPARVATGRLRAGLRSLPAATLTDLHTGNVKGLLRAEGRLLELDGEGNGQVSAPLPGLRPGAAAPPAEEGVEDVTEAWEVAEALETNAACVGPGMAKAVLSGRFSGSLSTS